MEKKEIKKTLEELVDIDEVAKKRLSQMTELQEVYQKYIEEKKEAIDAYYNNIYEKKTKEFYNAEIRKVLAVERDIEKATEEEKEKLTVAIEKSKSDLVSKLFDYMVLGGKL